MELLVNQGRDTDRRAECSTGPPPSLVVADDHVVFAQALESVLRHEGFAVVAMTSTLGATLATVQDFRPTVCLLDWHFTDGNGLALIGELRAVSPRTAIIVVTADPDPAGVQRAAAAGAAGYIHKTLGVATLVRAIRRVIAGAVAIDVPAPRAVPDRGDLIWRAAEYLTDREWQCLELLSDGQGTTAIADLMGISETTVRSHIHGLLTKLGAHTRLEAASLAARYNLINNRKAGQRVASIGV